VFNLKGSQSMDAESVALLQSGATTLVGLMVTDAWHEFRTRMAVLFGRGGQDLIDVTTQELDESRAQLLAAHQSGDVQALEDVEGEWRSRLRRLLAANPQAAAKLRAIVEEFAPYVERSPDRDNINISGTFHAPVLGKGTQNIR
jgi:Spy/CpxP family protein refolding chaperone